MPMKKTFVYDTSCHRFTIFEPQILFDTPSEEFVVILHNTWYQLAYRCYLIWQNDKVQAILASDAYIQVIRILS